jgi:hypothetical protein
MDLEEYRFIKDYENYEVSNFGNVRNSKTSRILKPNLHKDGYHLIGLWKDGKQNFFQVHRLVAIMFIDNVDDKPTVDHLDRNPKNNNILNLRWATFSEQVLNRDYYHIKQTEHHHIRITSFGTFEVRIKKNKKLTCKTFKTLKEAIIYRDVFIKNNPK